MADNDTSDFSEAFSERAKPEGGENGGEGASAATVTTEAATTDEAASAASDAAPSQEAADDTSGTSAPAFDPWAGMTPEQKAHFERLAASERSQRGRVGALTKKLNAQNGTQQPPTKSEDQASQGGEGETQAATDAGGIEQKLKAIADGEYADVVGPVADVIADLRKEIGELKASKTRDAEVDADAAELAEAYTVLEAAHPDYAQIGASAEFNEWVGKQPKKVVDLLNSYDPQEVSLGLTLYKAESKTASDTNGDAEQGNTGGAATDQKRTQQLGGLRQATTRGAPAASGVPNDFKSAFKARANQPS